MEKVFSQVPKDVVWWAFRKLVVDEYLIILHSQCIGMLKMRVNGTFNNFLV